MWWKKFWLNTVGLFISTRGDAEDAVPGEKDNEDGDDNADKSEEDSESTDAKDKGESQEESEEGSGEDEEADKPDEELVKMFGSDFKKLGKAYRELQNTSKPKEMNLAAITKWAEKLGLKPSYDAKGNFVKFDMDRDRKPEPSEKERPRRFTDEHRKVMASYFNNEKGANKFLEHLTLFTQDLLDDGILAREKMARRAMDFRREEIKCEKAIAERYPDANPDNEGFPEGGTPLYNRAREIYAADKDYQNHPRGQLFAVLDAATELGISPKAIDDAKKAGIKEGQEGKRILSRVSGFAGGGTKKTAKSGEDVSLTDFFSMTPEQREKYQENALKKKLS